MRKLIASDLKDQALLNGASESLSYELRLAGHVLEFEEILLTLKRYTASLFFKIRSEQNGKANAEQSEEILKVMRLQGVLADLVKSWGVLLEESSSSSLLWMTTKKLSATDVKVLSAHLQTADNILGQMQGWCPKPVIDARQKGMEEFKTTAASAAKPESTPAAPAIVKKEGGDEKEGGDKEESKDKKGPLLSSPLLSKRIADTVLQEYEISQLRLWLRRLAWLLSAIVTTGAIIAVVAVLTSQGITPFDPSVIWGSVCTAFVSLGAFFGGPLPIVSSSIIFGGLPVTLETPVPPTLMQPLQVIATPFMLRRSLAKYTVQPPREMAAVNAQVASVHLMAEELLTKLKGTAFGSGDVSKYVKSGIERATSLYRDGVRCTLESSRYNRITKARLILYATAKVLETSPGAIQSLSQLLDFKVQGTSTTEYSYGQIINANRSSWWKKEKTASATLVEGQEKTSFGKNLQLDEVSNGLALASAA